MSVETINIIYKKENLQEITSKLQRIITNYNSLVLFNVNLNNAINQIILDLDRCLNYKKIENYLIFNFRDFNITTKFYYKIINFSSIGSDPMLTISFFK